jgi:hypothetical protein
MKSRLCLLPLTAVVALVSTPVSTQTETPAVAISASFHHVAAGSTSGAIGIFNPVHAAFTATGFTVH